MVYLLLADGFEEAEALVTADLLRRAGVELALVGLNGLSVSGAHHITVTADCLLSEVGEDVEMVILPGGVDGVKHMMMNLFAQAFIQRAGERGSYVAAICAAPTILAHLCMLDRRKAVCYPGLEEQMYSAVVQKEKTVVADGRIITGEAAGSVFEFALKLVEVLKGVETAQKVKESVCYRH